MGRLRLCFPEELAVEVGFFRGFEGGWVEVGDGVRDGVGDGVGVKVEVGMVWV